MNKILVSVIVPVYNVKNYINQCLDSIVKQTLKDIEIILIDDCSTDGTTEILEQYAKCDGRIKIIHTEKNVNAGAARNIGIRIAQGEYLSFLDSDDFFSTELLERIYLECKKDSLDICIYDYAKFNDIMQQVDVRMALCKTDEELVKDCVFSIESLGDRILPMWTCALWTRLIRRELVVENGLFCQEIHNANDTFFSYATLACAKRVKYVTYEEPLMFYRINTKGQLSNNRGKSPYCIYEALKEVVRFYRENYSGYMREDFYRCIMSHIMNSIKSVDGDLRKELVVFYKEKGLSELGMIDAIKNRRIKGYQYRYISAIINYTDEDIDFILQAQNEDTMFRNDKKTVELKPYIGNRKAVLWGAGKLGLLFAEECRLGEIILHGVVDKDESKQGSQLLGYNISSVENGIKTADAILVTNTRWMNDILKELESHKFKGEVIDLYSYYGCGLRLEECIINFESSIR